MKSDCVSSSYFINYIKGNSEKLREEYSSKVFSRHWTKIK